ncbi:MAG: hypothetical protein IPI59_03155 [Sphingobacteriales bacterium]|jgi:hypothetical protein|nr:hypothetical protein [Sphingobacteriales bacterium]MBP9140542.1 hypothetical protein [Chitinophagales bacterium]MDA0197278.1 hypothetical protein [Bacteroidota bacterium]MBK7526557.1 hypothetical protein [Sphingobacteriales bacterium]MBL0248341.1 hypothetical protein [Sphingobacteriales bacterium]
MSFTPAQQITIAHKKHTPLVQIKLFSEFEQLLARWQPEVLFISRTKQTLPEHLLPNKKESGKKTYTQFSFFQNGLFYAINGLNYNNLTDYREGQKAGFTTGDEYYQAQQAGFLNFADYNACLKAGFTNRANYQTAAELGFENALQKLHKSCSQKNLLDTTYKKLIHHCHTDADIWHFATQHGYTTYTEFEQAVLTGFANANAPDFRKALEQGFQSPESFYQAQKGQFESPNELAAAQQHGITQKDELENYQKLTNIAEAHQLPALDQALLYDLLTDLQPNRKIAVDRLWKMLKEAEKSLRTPAEDRKWFDRPLGQLFSKGKIPAWYTTSLQAPEDISIWLLSQKNANNLGHYDPDGEVFERFSIN